MSPVVFTLRDGLCDSDYFKCNYFLVEIYLNRVSLMNLQRILIIHCAFATETCNVEEIVSKVIIIACDYLLVSKMPKTRRKSEGNKLFQKNKD